MNTPIEATELEFGGPATYRVVIQGALSKQWTGRLGGMAITTSSEKGGTPQTTLSGRIPDQAALHGLLNTLYALHLPILEVSRVQD